MEIVSIRSVEGHSTGRRESEPEDQGAGFEGLLRSELGIPTPAPAPASAASRASRASAADTAPAVRGEGRAGRDKTQRTEPGSSRPRPSSGAPAPEGPDLTGVEASEEVDASEAAVGAAEASVARSERPIDEQTASFGGAGAIARPTPASGAEPADQAMTAAESQRIAARGSNAAEGMSPSAFGASTEAAAASAASAASAAAAASASRGTAVNAIVPVSGSPSATSAVVTSGGVEDPDAAGREAGTQGATATRPADGPADEAEGRRLRMLQAETIGERPPPAAPAVATTSDSGRSASPAGTLDLEGAKGSTASRDSGVGLGTLNLEGSSRETGDRGAGDRRAPGDGASDPRRVEPQSADGLAFRPGIEPPIAVESRIPPSASSEVPTGIPTPVSAAIPAANVAAVIPANAEAPPAGATPPPPAADALAIQTEWLATRGGGSARLVLNPPELGELAIRVSLRDGAVDVVMIAHEAAAKAIAEDQSERLARAFSARDLRMGSFEVRQVDTRALMDGSLEGRSLEGQIADSGARDGGQAGRDPNGAGGSSEERSAGVGRRAALPGAGLRLQTLSTSGERNIDLRI